MESGPIICQLYVSYEAGLVYGEWTYYIPVICQLLKQDQFMESGPIICQLYATYEAGLVYGEWTYYMPVICQL